MATIETNARLTAAMVNTVLKKRVEPIFTRNVFMAMLKSKGRITYGNGGDEVKWRPRFRRSKIVPGDGNPQNISFPQPNFWKEAKLPWRNYNLGTSVNKFERLATQNSTQTLFKLVDEVIRIQADDFMVDFGEKLYYDGNSASTPKDLHGLESMFSVSGVLTNGVCGAPNDTYANLSTALGNYGGDWTADASNAWPTGTGSREYHFWTPLVVSYTNTGLSSESTHTWSTQWQHALNYAITYGGTLQQKDYDLILLNTELLRLAKDSLIGKTQIEVTQQSDLTKLGFKTLQYQGIEMTSEYAVPTGVGYLLSFEDMELMSMQKQLLGKSNDQDIRSLQDLYAVDFFGQLRFEAPSYFAKVAALG